MNAPVSRPGTASPGFCFVERIRLLIALVLCLTIQSTFAGSATWKTDPVSNDWNTAANWTPETVPNGPEDVATFATYTKANIRTSRNIEVNGIVFGVGASPFRISPGNFSFDEVILTLSGTGITNNSGIAQNLATTVSLLK